MGKIILEFDSIEEYEEARAALDGINWKRVVIDLDYKFRQAIKSHASEIEIEVSEKYRQILREILNEYFLSICQV